VLAVAAFVFSFQPSVVLAGIKVPLPSALLGLATSFWRDYGRFGVLVGFGSVTLAALGLSALSQRGGRWRLLAPVAIVVAVLELLPGNVPTLNAAAVPAWAVWLRSQPRGIVATYPWLFSDSLADDEWYQMYDGDPEFGITPFQELSRTSSTQALRDEAVRLLARDICCGPTAGVLATEGVRYVVVHEDAFRAAGQTAVLDPSNYRLLKRIGDVAIYSVHAAPIDIAHALQANASELAALEGVAPTFVYGSGFNAPEVFDGGTSRWMIEDGELDFDAGLPTRVTLTGLAFSNQEPRLLELIGAGGRILGRVEVGDDAGLISFGPFLLPAGEARLTLRAVPGPEVLGPSDPREASVFLEPLSVSALPVYLAGSKGS
jgi:hypothetical protein